MYRHWFCQLELHILYVKLSCVYLLSTGNNIGIHAHVAYLSRSTVSILRLSWRPLCCYIAVDRTELQLIWKTQWARCGPSCYWRQTLPRRPGQMTSPSWSCGFWCCRNHPARRRRLRSVNCNLDNYVSQLINRCGEIFREMSTEFAKLDGFIGHPVMQA